MIRIPERPIAVEEVHSVLLAEGFEVCHRTPFTAGSETTDWERGPQLLSFVSNINSGLCLFIIFDGPETERVLELVQGIAPCVAAEELVRADASAEAPAAQVLAAMRMRLLGRLSSFEPSLPQPLMAEALSRMLGSLQTPVWSAALEAAFELEWSELDEAVLALSKRHPEMDWVAESWNRMQVAREEQRRAAAAEQEREELHAALNALVVERRWEEALAAALRAFEEEDPPLQAFRTRALANDGLERYLEAALWTAFWWAKTRTDEALAKLDELSHKLASSPLGRNALLRGQALDSTDWPLQLLEGWEKVDDVELGLAGVDALRVRLESVGLGLDLAFCSGALRINKSYERSKQLEALPLLEHVMAECPGLVDGWVCLALARAARQDLLGAEAAYRQAIDALSTQDRHCVPHTAMEHFMRRLQPEPFTELSLRRALAYLYVQASDHENLYRVVNEEEQLEGIDRAAVLHDRAVAATATQRHDEAIRDYRGAIAAGHADRYGLLHFNLACELARQGRTEEALDALGEAIERDDEWRDKARDDAYFDPIRGELAFRALLAGIDDAPTAEQVERSISRSSGRHLRGEGEAAIEEAEYAVVGAELLAAPRWFARALSQLGTMLTYHKSPEQGLTVLERASEVAAEAFASDPIERARVLHALAAGQHAANRWEEAEASYRETLELREEALGELSFELAITLGDLSRLASDRGRWEEAEHLASRTQGILEQVLLSSEGDDRLDVLLNLVLSEGNRASYAQTRKLGASAVMERAASAVGYLEQLREGGATLPVSAIRRLRNAVGAAASEKLSAELADLCLDLQHRLLVLEFPDPRVREEKFYWAGIRQGIRELQAAGAEDTQIAEGLARAVRGEAPGEPVGSHPAFANLSAELARRLTAQGDLVMVAMSLEMALSGAQPVEEAVGTLEVFALAKFDDDER